MQVTFDLPRCLRLADLVSKSEKGTQCLSAGAGHLCDHTLPARQAGSLVPILGM